MGATFMGVAAVAAVAAVALAACSGASGGGGAVGDGSQPDGSVSVSPDGSIIVVVPGDDGDAGSGGCGAGLLACDGGCVANDVANCGACGHACTTGDPFGTPACSAGQCAITCPAQHHACPGSGADAGADASTAAATFCADDTSVETCGASCTTCPAAQAHASKTCTGAPGGPPACGTACNTGFSTCGGACVDLANDATNCGTCGHVCTPGGCSSGQCTSWTVAAPPTTGDPRAIACNGTNLVWTDGTYGVLEVPAGGGAAIKLLDQTQWTAYLPQRKIAIANGVVAWIGGSSTLSDLFVFTAVDGSAGSGALGPGTAGDPGASVGAALNATGTTVFFSDQTTSTDAHLYQCSLGGVSSSCKSVATFVVGAALRANDLISKGDGTVYFTENTNGSVMRFTPATDQKDGPGALATGQGSPFRLAIDSSYLYWGGIGVSGSAYVTRATRASPFTASTVLPNTSGSLTALATDGAYVYIGGSLTPTAAATFTLAAVPVSGGAPVPLATTGDIESIVAVNGAVYWLDVSTATIYGRRYP